MDYDTQKEDAYTTSKAALGLIYAFSLLKKTRNILEAQRILYEENKKRLRLDLAKLAYIFFNGDFRRLKMDVYFASTTILILKFTHFYQVNVFN